MLALFPDPAQVFITLQATESWAGPGTRLGVAIAIRIQLHLVSTSLVSFPDPTLGVLMGVWGRDYYQPCAFIAVQFVITNKTYTK